MKMDFFGEGTKEISSMRVFYAIVGLVVGAVISSVTEYYGLRDKTSYGYCTKSVRGRNQRDCRFGNRNDFYFSNRIICSSNLDFLQQDFMVWLWLLQQ
jgi:hypothetical protein